MLDQAIGLAMYDPDALRRARPGGVAGSTCPRCCPSAREHWSERRKLEVAEMILATLRGFLVDARTSGDAAGIDAGLRGAGPGARARGGRRRVARRTAPSSAGFEWTSMRTTWFTCRSRKSGSRSEEWSCRCLCMREKVRFASGDTECAAWHYPGTNGACVVMAGGFAVTKEPGTDLFAQAIPRRRVRCARLRLPPSRGERRASRARSSASGSSSPTGRPRSRSPRPCRESTRPGSRSGASPPPAATSSASRRATRSSRRRSRRRRTPTARPPRATRRATRSRSRCCASPAAASSTRSAVWSAARRCWCRSPAQPGTVAMLTTPDALDGDRALNPDNRYPDWQQAVAARSALRIGFYRPGRVRVPGAVPAAGPRLRPGSDGAGRARRPRRRSALPAASSSGCPGGHYEPFLGGHEQAVEAELSFLRRHLLDRTRRTAPRLSAHAPEATGHERDRAVRRDDRVRGHRRRRARRSCCCTG